jgi:hypothetical protein
MEVQGKTTIKLYALKTMNQQMEQGHRRWCHTRYPAGLPKGLRAMQGQFFHDFP